MAAIQRGLELCKGRLAVGDGLLAQDELGQLLAAQAISQAPAVAQTSKPEDLNRQTLQQRAIDAAIWGMPIVSMDAMRQAFFRDAKAKYNDIVYWSEPSDWKTQITTPNGTVRYVYFNFNTKAGPAVVEIPPSVEAGLFGPLLDAWQTPLADIGPQGEDQGSGGRYLLLPPDFKGETPSGYIIVRAPTYNGCSALRVIPKSSSDDDVSAAIALVKCRSTFVHQGLTGARPLH